MLCPHCQHENIQDAVTCAACEKDLAPPRLPPPPPGLIPPTPYFTGVSPTAVQAPYNICAILSLPLSIAGLVCLGIVLAPAGLVLGIIGMTQCRKRGDRGYGLALAGTIVSGLVFLLNLVILIFFFVGPAATSVKGGGFWP